MLRKSFLLLNATPNLTRVPPVCDRVRQLRQQRQQLGRTPPRQQLRGSFRQVQELLLQRTWHRRVQRKVREQSLLFTHSLPLNSMLLALLGCVGSFCKAPNKRFVVLRSDHRWCTPRLSPSTHANLLMLTFARVQIRARRLQR